MGGLAAVTPESAIPTTTVIPRINDPLTLHEKIFIQIAEVPTKEVENALHDIIIKPLPHSSMSPSMHTLDTVKNTWAVMHQSNFEVSGWGSFTKKYPGFRDNARSRIIVLPFAFDVPSKLYTIYSCLKFARENTCMNALIATFDQPLCQSY